MTMLKKIYRKFAELIRPFRWRIEILTKTIFSLCLYSMVLKFPKLARKLAPIKPMALQDSGKSVLFVSYYAPPYKSSYGTQRVTKFTKYLRKIGWQVTFLTTQPARNYEIDSKGEAFVDGINVCHVPGIVDHPLMRKGILPPDDFVIWAPTAVTGIKNIIQATPIDVIVATAPPYTNMLAAAVCSVRSGIPLVTDFRDPWTKIDTYWIIKNTFSKYISKFLEAKVLKVSSRVVMTDEKFYYSDFFPENLSGIKEKVVSITNGFDEADFLNIPFGEAQEKSTKSFIFSYVGGLYSEENAQAILNVLIEWARHYPDDMKNVIFEYAGSDGKLLKDATNIGINYLDHGYVSHVIANQIRDRCSVQIFAQPTEFKAHVLSGKIFEMIRNPKPILALTRQDGAVARLLKETNTGITFTAKDTVAAAQLLKMWYDLWRQSGHIKYEAVQTAVAQYSREHLTVKLSDVLEEVCRKT